MSSSSSESEDDSRFREACDPTLAVPYGSNTSKSSISEKPGHRTLNGNSLRVPNIPRTSHDTEETRESLLLAHKIQCLLNTKNIKDIVSGISSRENYTQGVTSSCRRKKNLLNDDNLPSTLSSYLDKKLTRLLDEKVEIRATNDAAETPCTTEFNNNGLLLLKNQTVKSCINSSSENELKKPKRASISNTYNKNEVAQRCHSIALSPQWIMNMQDVYPWAHPKNIRYVDKYKLKNRKADGSIVAVPLADDHVDVSKLKSKWEKLKRCDQTSKRTGEDVGGELTEENTSDFDGKTQTSIKTDKAHTLKLTNVAEHTANFGDFRGICAVKKRKQSRKRSGKKAKKKLELF